MNQHLKEVTLFVRMLRRRFATAALARRYLTILATACAGCALVQVLFAVFPWVALPVLWDLLIAALAAGAAASALDIFWWRRPGLAAVASIAESQARLPHPWLSLSLELSHSKPAGSADLAASVYENGASVIPLCPSRPSVTGLRRLGIALALSAAALVLSGLFLQPRCAAFWKLPFSYFSPVRAAVWPGTVHVPTGALCTVRLSPALPYFPSCRLVCSALDGTPVANTLLSPGDSGRFSLSLGAITRSVAYQFTLGNTAFPPDTLFVVPKPQLSGLRILVTPPRYTGLKPAALPEGQGNFAAYPGTKAHFYLSAPYPLKRAKFVSPGADTLALSVTGCEAEGEVVVASRRSYTFALADTFGQASDSIPLFSIEVIPDAPPSVYFEKPGRNKDCSAAMRETLWVEAIDDIGIRSMSVATQKNSEPAVPYIQRVYSQQDSMVKLARLELPLALSGFSLYPGDTLRYWANACDNRVFHGSQCVASDTFFFRVPSFEEIHEQVSQEQDYTEHALQSAQRKNSDLQQSVANLVQSAQGKKSLSWEQQQIVRDLKQEMAAQADSLSKAVQSFREAVDKLKQEQSVPSDLLSKMNEVQKAIEELRQQYGDSLLFSMPKGNESVSMRDLQQSLEKLKNTLPDLASRLETTLKFLQALKRDQALARLAANAERLAREQQDAASLPRDAGECLSKQENVSKGVDGLLSEINKNTQQSDSALFSKNQLPALDKLCPLQKSMQSRLGSKVLPSKDDMNAMAGSLSSLAENLSDMQSSAMARRFGKEREVLLDITHDALSMARMQQSIAETSRSPDGSAGETAELEQNLSSALSSSMEKMNRLTMVSPQSLLSLKKSYDHAAASLRDAISLLSGANRQIFSEGPASDLGAIAQTSLDALGQLSGESQAQSSGMGGMMSGLRRLSSRQALLNAATGELLRGMLGEGGTEGNEGKGSKQAGGGKQGSGSQRAKAQAAAAQKAIADELKRLADKYGKEAGASLDKKARELEDEARKLSTMFANPSQELRDRQDRFLSRMLETSLSQHKQDEDKEQRTSQSAKSAFSPQQDDLGAANGSRGLDTYYRLRQRAFAGNFPESYRFSVKSYFDSLGVLFLKEK
jgi:hypothetical protein